MPQISIIIPAYNAQQTILETIASVQEQTFQDWELIVVNDGSKDRTLEVLRTLNEPRLRVFSYTNGGVCKARDRGFAQAQGEYIAFLDADDLWLPEKLELQLKALQKNPSASVAYSWTCFMDEQPEKVLFHYSAPYKFTGNVYRQLLISDFIHSGSNTLIRKAAIEAVGSFDPNCPGCADWDYWLRLAAQGEFVVVPKHHILYRRRAGSMSTNVAKMRREALIAINKAYRMAPPELRHLKDRTLANLYKYCSDIHLRNSQNLNDLHEAGAYLRLALCLRPLNLFDRTTQKLAIKWLLRRLFPSGIVNYLSQILQKPITSNDPRVQI